MKKGEPANPAPNAVFTPASPAPFGTGFLAPAKLPDVARAPQPGFACPRCSKLNALGSPVCKFCKQVFSLPPVATRRLEDPDQLKRIATKPDSSFFGPTSSLLLMLQGHKKPLQAYPRRQLVIGRTTAMQVQPVNIDLSAYDAEALGVSRAHAQLRCQNNKLMLTDLKSQNGTFVNELRLYPNEMRVLRSGDSIRLGSLILTVTFKHC